MIRHWAVGYILFAIVLICTWYGGYTGGYTAGQDSVRREQSACVDAHHSGVQAAKAALDGKRVCEGSR